MRAAATTRVGRHGLEITRMGLGCAPFGNLALAVVEQTAVDTMTAAHAAGVRYFDVAPLYGYGLSESRVGAGLAHLGRDGLVISTKVGQTLVTETGGPSDDHFVHAPASGKVYDFSRDAILRCIEGSLKRLKTDRIDIALIHDPDLGQRPDSGTGTYISSHLDEVMEQTYPVLDDLRARGTIKAVGLGMNQWQMLHDFALAGDFDCFLLAGRYTLLEQESMHELLPLCQEKGIGIIIGGPYNSGVLATGAVKGALYNYRPAPADILDRTRRIEAVCARHNVPLAAAALQFPFGHPAVASIIPGAKSVAEVQANAAFFEWTIPADLWAELKSLSLLEAEAPVPTDADTE